MIPDRVKFRHLQAFLETARLGGVTVAAEGMNVTQPALSRTLKELEEILGVRLMDRSRAGVALTPAGEVFRTYASASLAAMRQGVNSVSRAQAEGEILRIGVLPSVAASVIPAAAASFAATETARLVIQSGPNAQMLDQLRMGRLDMVVGRLAGSDAMRSLSFEHLYSERISFAVRPGHPLLSAPDLSTFTEYLVLYPDADAAIRPGVDHLMIGLGIGQPPRRIETVSEAFGRVFTRQSDAIWIISSGVIATELAEGRLVDLPGPNMESMGPVGLSTRFDHDPTPAQLAFARAVRDAATSRQQRADGV